MFWQRLVCASALIIMLLAPAPAQTAQRLVEYLCADRVDVLGVELLERLGDPAVEHSAGRYTIAC